jgi:opacity protein-like surface antigen
MRMRSIALAGVGALCLMTPAAASDAHGWYLGLGAGWDHLGNIDLRYAPNANDLLHSGNAALFTGSLGYRLPSGIRIELELGWDRHDLHSTGIGSTNDNGRISNLTGALNALYDWRITNRWAFSFGGGVGMARTDLDVSAPNPAGGIINVANGRQGGFMAQAIAGFTYSVTDNVDLGLDWRYRELAGNNFSTSRPFAGADAGPAVVLRIRTAASATAAHRRGGPCPAAATSSAGRATSSTTGENLHRLFRFQQIELDGGSASGGERSSENCETAGRRSDSSDRAYRYGGLSQLQSGPLRASRSLRERGDGARGSGCRSDRYRRQELRRSAGANRTGCA